ncbi:MAG: MmcB family DNA repair protein [Notoacmeibacter sp.]
MPILTPHATDPFADGRQSANALMVRRGVMLMLMDQGFVLVPEMTLKTGRRADLAALSPKGDIWIVEIKSSLEDLRADNKWQEYRDFCDAFYFATHSGVAQSHFPTEAGFIISDAYGAEILSPSPEHRLAAAARKALTLRFARLAAGRAMRAELGLKPDDFVLSDQT